MTDSLRLAGSTRDCPGCPACLPEGSKVTTAVTCGPDGLPIRRVWVFPDATGIRVVCRHGDVHTRPYSEIAVQLARDCPKCQGHEGWTAATDGWLWIDAAMSLGLLFSFPGGAQKGFFQTVIAAVEAHEGWQLMEEPDGSN